jgi:GTP cyclohydrolase II
LTVATDARRRSVERAIDAARRGWPVTVQDGSQALTVVPIELATDDRLVALEAGGPPARLLLSGPRAQTLRIINQRAAAGHQAVLLARMPWQDLPQLVAIADPVQDLALPFKGPFPVDPLNELEQAATAAIALLKAARLLPAALVITGVASDATTVAAQDALTYEDDRAAALRIVTRAQVPLVSAAQSQLVAFSSGDGGVEHLAIVIGDPPRDQPVLARVHSECFTGDLLGSLKCDCGPQLKGALDAIGAAGGGVLLYLAQEGRGIGLINKLRAYALQDQGFDTVDANLRLGFAVDERAFAPAAAMLRLLGFGAVRLMTNNPDKVAELAAHGITVAERVAHSFPANSHNALYLATKKLRTGHLL